MAVITWWCACLTGAVAAEFVLIMQDRRNR